MLLSSSRNLDRAVRDAHDARDHENAPMTQNSHGRIAAERAVSC